MMPTHGYGNMQNHKKLTHLTNHKISQKYDVGDLLHTRCRGDNSPEEKSVEVRQRSHKTGKDKAAAIVVKNRQKCHKTGAL